MNIKEYQNKLIDQIIGELNELTILPDGEENDMIYGKRKGLEKR